MNGSADAAPSRRLAPRYVVAYLCWFALGALGLWAALQLRLAALAIVFRTVARDRAQDSVTATGQVRSLDNLITVVLILAWLGGTVLLEAHLREAVPTGRLRARAGTVLLALLALLALAYALQALL
jgi:hypothetical protein